MMCLLSIVNELLTSYAVKLAVIRPGGKPASEVRGDVFNDLLLDHSKR